MRDFLRKELFNFFGSLICILLFMPMNLHAEWFAYQVDKNDQLGKLIQSLGLKIFIWGDNGLAQIVYAYNSKVLSSPDLLQAGQIIYLPESAADLALHPLVSKDSSKIMKADKEEVSSTSEELVSSELTATPGTMVVERMAILRVGVPLSLMRRDLVDKTTKANGKLETDAIYGVELISELPISEYWNIDTSLVYRKISFARSNTKTFDIESENFLKISLGLSRIFNKLVFGGGVTYEQLPIVTGISSTHLGLKSFTVLSPYMSLDWNFHEWGKSALGLGLSGSYNLSSSKDGFNLNSGFDVQLELDLLRELSRATAYSVIPFVQYGVKDTDTVKHTDIDTGIKLMLNWIH